MKSNESQKKTFFDLLIESSRNNREKQENMNPKEEPKKSNPFYILGFILAFPIYSLAIYLLFTVLSAKFGVASLSYWECMKIYFGLWAISILIKRR